MFECIFAMNKFIKSKGTEVVQRLVEEERMIEEPETPDTNPQLSQTAQQEADAAPTFIPRKSKVVVYSRASVMNVPDISVSTFSSQNLAMLLGHDGL